MHTHMLVRIVSASVVALCLAARASLAVVPPSVVLTDNQAAIRPLGPVQATATIPVVIDTPGHVLLSVQTQAGPFIWALATPGGTVLDNATIGAAPYNGTAFITPPQAPPLPQEGGLPIPYLPDVGSWGTRLDFTAPAAGVYTVFVSETPQGFIQRPLVVLVSQPESAVKATLFSHTLTVPQGDFAVMSAIVSDGGAPVVGASVNATLVRPDQSREPLVASDTGEEFDARAGDGVYTLDFITRTGLTTFEPTGTYTVIADVTGTNSLGNAFLRNTATTFEVTPPCPSLPADVAANLGDQGIDENSDGCFESIEITLYNVTIRAPGTYRLALSLHGNAGSLSNKRFRAEGDATFTTVPSGPVPLRARVSFSPDDLKAFEAAQTFVVDGLSVTAERDGTTTVCEERSGLSWTTGEYMNLS